VSLPFIPFANCAEVVIRSVFSSQAIYLTFGVQKVGAFAGTDLSDIADIVADHTITDLLPHQHALLTTNDVKVTDLTTQFSPIFVGGTGLPLAGSGATSPATTNTALVVSFKTDKRGRAFRGRNYIAGLLAAELATADEWGATIVADMVSYYNGMFGDLGAAGFTAVVLSRQENGVRRTVGEPTQITAVLGRTAIGTQRRRVIGHGI